ncbi:hypothetical protein F5Y03DRAFT_355656 [Xylaria venustula]|nr:hypothetical protein F5Y03DRAFT_355656 [Xylaria venustula]
MDMHSQDAPALPENRVDSNVDAKPRNSQHIQPTLSLPREQSHCAQANEEEKMSPMTGHAKGEEGPDSQTETPKEPPSSEPPSPLKKTLSSTRTSSEIFRSLTADDDDSKSKRSRLSVGDSSSSTHTVDSNEERRLSDKMKKAWREVRGQSRLDPLEQWMVKHSGGTFREFKEKPGRQAFGESSDK